ncbi:hypothetical protein [Tessaracoccus coleopterorum]|uniref:hypothetical protein n=1 Tax=Tessaracoccus coleopterorum TaxID=2714950 RepID=UPI001E31BF01|nr:hypothetical protein [Tessaracoccus coleopterorum]
MKTSAASLGDPRNTDEITISLGEQMGAITPATLQTAQGELRLDVQSYGNQWRVQFVESIG